MARRAKKHKDFIIKCSHCFESEFKLFDVNPDDPIKYYTDTPFKMARLTPSAAKGSAAKKKIVVVSPCKFNQDENTNFKGNADTNYKFD